MTRNLARFVKKHGCRVKMRPAPGGTMPGWM
jgi:beta-galactosidase GanA